MQKKKQTKSIILITIIVIILLLIMFSEDIIKLQNKNKIGLSENAEQELTNTTNEPNVPKLSAGMIPIKWDGNYWTITTKDDNTWYDYSNNQPAYIMLNDGTYQSELIRNMEGKKLAEKNIGAQIQENELGTIFVWIPRFAINDNDNGEINYIKDTGTAEEGWTIPELFEYKQDETKPDFILTGAWVEKEIDANATSKIKEMSKEEGTYGFLAHTKATQISTNEIRELQKYTLIDTLEDITNQNRITLKIIDEDKQYPIKAKGEYNKDTGIITIQVTYSQYGIKQILLEEMELTFSKTNGITTADTTGIELEDGINTITIIDNKDNKKELKIQVISKIYATLYRDGTLAFGKTANPLPEKTISRQFGDISKKTYSFRTTPWYEQRMQITTVNFANKISPVSTAWWFYYLEKLTTIENINNLNTSNVTDVRGMFYGCKELTELNVGNFNTSNVTDMSSMFAYCSSLIKIDISNFDTSNVKNISGMFSGCSGLTELDVSNFDTSNVTDMSYMFYYCTGLTELDLSNFDTSNVTNMCCLFDNCSSLIELDVNNFDTNKVIDMSFMFFICSSLAEIDVSNFDTSNVTNMRNMFYRCTNLTELNVSNFDTSNVIDINGMFAECANLAKLDVSNFDTSNVTDMGSMFSGCSSLTQLNLSNFNTSNVTNIRYMFYYCTSLTDLDVSNFDTSNVTNMNFTFCACNGLTELNISNFDTSNVTDMSAMFNSCSSLTGLDLSNFDTRNVTDMDYMFNSCTNLKIIYVGENWSTSKANTTNMFQYCGTSSVTKK